VQAARLSAAAPLAALSLAAALGLAACGGGGGTSTSTSAAPAASTPTPSAKASPSAGGANPSAPAGGSSHPQPLTRASARAAERHAEAVQAARHRALAKQAGRAAPFLVPVGDNSIPTYGSESSASQLRAAEASLAAYLRAREAGDWSAACAQMAATLKRQLALLAGSEKGDGCAAAYAKLAAKISASARANPLRSSITAFRVQGDKGFVLFYGTHDQQYMLPTVLESGTWKVSQLEPIPWPIGAQPQP